MKKLLIVATVAIGGFTLSQQPAMAAGCVSGAAVGGVAGHVAGHHGVLGAAAGCAIGHHEANKQTKAAQTSAPSNGSAPANNTGTTTTN